MSRLFTSIIFVFGVIFCFTGCVPASSATEEIPRPSQLTPLPSFTGEPTPESSLFYSLPLHQANEEVLAGGYGIRLDGINFNDAAGSLRLDLTITNTTDSLIDLGWAVQLRDGNGGLVQPQKGSKSSELHSNVAPGTSLSGAWIYPAATSTESQSALSLDAYEDYRLVFAPKGWSGPVIIYKLIP